MTEKLSGFPEQLSRAIHRGLPGTDIQWMMASSDRLLKDFPTVPGPGTREAAVLILLWPEKRKIKTVFMQRPEYAGFHGGQISFPGGKREPGDESLLMTAFREAEEETGIDASLVQPLGILTPLFIPVSNTVVTAVPAWTGRRPVFEYDPLEVSYLIEADLAAFLGPSIVKIMPMEIRGEVYDIRYFDYEGHVIWGATSMMLNELLEIIKRDNIDTRSSALQD
jgi:8-oxo-dGTP pyrophosphatase MutT (NUDIX family)